MSERDLVYLEILERGLLSLRIGARVGNSKYCEVEAEHLQNLPSLIEETDEKRHEYYLNAERPNYLEYVDRSVPGIDHTLVRYGWLWKQLEQYKPE